MNFASFLATRRHVDDLGAIPELDGHYSVPTPGFVYDDAYAVCDPVEQTNGKFFTNLGNHDAVGSLHECEVALYNHCAAMNGWPLHVDSGYGAACVRHADEQGVTRIMDALAVAGFDPELEQTGGFCMCWSITLSNGVYLAGTAEGAGCYGSEDACSLGHEPIDDLDFSAIPDGTGLNEATTAWVRRMIAEHGGAKRTYQIAVTKADGNWDVVERFDAANDSAANAYAEVNHSDIDWYVLDEKGVNING